MTTIYNSYRAMPDPDGWASFDHIGTFLAINLAEKRLWDLHRIPLLQIYRGPRSDCVLDGETHFPEAPHYSEFGVIETVTLTDK